MRILIPGLKAWPLHHEVEHLLAEAMRAAGHEVFFLGCRGQWISNCECVDMAIHQNAGSHAAFCANCVKQQGGIHAKAGFRELALASLAPDLFTWSQQSSLDTLLEHQLDGVSFAEILEPSLMRFARSGRPIRERVPETVIREAARTLLVLESQLPALLERESIDGIFLLNGLFSSERAISMIAKKAGLRVVNYERGHTRNTFVMSDKEPACFLKIDELLTSQEQSAHPLLDRYLDGRATNRDASTQFGTGSAGTSTPAVSGTRPLVAIFTNVCWDSAVSTRPSGFGTYFDWLEACLNLAQQRDDVDFLLRVHPGESTLKQDPTLDRTVDWLSEHSCPANLKVIAPEDSISSYQIMQDADVGLVFVTSVGLEMACMGKPVITCADTHYSSKGFTLDCGGSDEFEACLNKALQDAGADSSENSAGSSLRASAARSYADHLFFDSPIPFPWVDEVEYGRPQRLALPLDARRLEADPHLKRLAHWIATGEGRPASLRYLLEGRISCPLPFHYGSRLAPDTGRVGVIIPAWERPDKLLRALQSWANQTIEPTRFEILVIDDGSTVPLEDSLKPALTAEALSRFQVRFLRLNDNAGPARARNRGMDFFMDQDAPPTLVLFVGDDIEPEPNYLVTLLEEYQAWGDESMALLGRVHWPDDAPVNRVMDLIERNGMQFAYASLPARAMLPANCFYTCSVAISSAWLRKHPLRFNETFPFAAWEDTEFAGRAMEQGMRLAYAARVQATHRHPMDYVSFSKRQRKVGAAGRVYHSLNPKSYLQLAGTPPSDPPDFLLMQALETAYAELSKLDLKHLRVLDQPARVLTAELDQHQNHLLSTLFRLQMEAGWFERPVIDGGAQEDGLLSIVIPVFNRVELTRACLKSLAENTTCPFEVLLVDNGSTDDTPALEKEFSFVRLLPQGRNLGFARANNIGASAARGSILVLLNNDTEVHRGWDTAIHEELQNPDVGIVGLRLLYPDNTIQHAGVVFGNDGLPWHVYRGFPATAPEVMQRRELHAVTGACLAMRTRDYAHFHGLNENFINCYEDMDLCLRVRQSGLSVVYQPKGCVTHHEGKTAGRNEKVAHSWKVLQETTGGQLPFDEVEILASDGWEALRENGTLSLRRIPCIDPVKIEKDARELLGLGRLQQARDILANGSGLALGELKFPALGAMLLDLEISVGNVSAARELLDQMPATELQIQAVQDLEESMKARLRALGLEPEIT
jgi:GT2 family glycosyltransferase